jgi:hypothetical protein
MATIIEIAEHGNLSETAFTAVYEWSSSKIINVLLSIFSILFITPWLFYIIWYEKYGANHSRTLINQFAASHFYYAIFYNVVGQTLEVIITSFGPFGGYVCHFQEFIRGVMTFQLIQLFTFIVTVKYFYIFVLQNPSGIYEEFWCFFLNIWSLLISCIAEFIYQFLPGRSKIKLYICSGKFDNSLANEKVKQNYFLFGYLSLAIIWYCFAALKIHKYKDKIKKMTVVSVVIQDSQTTKALRLKDTFKVSLVNVAMIATLFLILVLNVVIVEYFNRLEPSSFNQSPNYQLHLCLDHGFLAINYVCTIVIYYSRNSVMRETIFREMKDDWLSLREQFSV